MGKFTIQNDHLTKIINIKITMVFTRHAEVGRVILITYGPDTGKLATIIDIVDQNKCLIDGPVGITGVQRQVLPFKRLALTDFKITIQVNARAKSLKKASKLKKDRITDFQRFQLMEIKKEKRLHF